MKTEPVFIVDTNVLVSAHLVEGSVTDLAFKKALKLGAISISEATMDELTEVVFRKKFDKYFKTDEARYKLIEKIEAYSLLFSTDEKIALTADPDDTIFLELAVAAKAACIISGDPHLLALHPFRGIPIINAATFLNFF